MPLTAPLRGRLPRGIPNWIGQELVPGIVGYPIGIIGQYPMNEDTADDNAELGTGGTFAAWTNDTPDDWIVIGEGGAGAYGTRDPEVSQVATGQSHANAGGETGGMCNIYTSDGTGISVTRIVSGFIVGRKYRFSIIIDTVTLGSISVQSGNPGFFTKRGNLTSSVSWTSVASNTSTDITIARTQGIGEVDVTFDDMSVKLCAAEDSSSNDNDMLMQRDTGGTGGADSIHRAGKIKGAFDFNGSSDFGEVGDIEADVKFIAMWVNPDAVNVTDFLIDLNGTDYITIVNGTVTKNGFGTGTQIIYVDGVVASTVTANWHFVVLTSTVGFDAHDLEIGRLEGSGYFAGLMDNVMLWNRIPSGYEIGRQFQNQFSAYRKRRHGGR